jgi:DNA-binding NtrC family response regulator
VKCSIDELPPNGSAADPTAIVNGRRDLSSVLIVDDESGIREILGRWLSADGYDTREAPDAETALDEMARAAADVVMCDVEMPGHGGLWLAAELGQRFPATAIILATALDSVAPMNSLKPSIVEYLLKPFAQDRVMRAVARGVEWHRMALAAPAAGGDRVAKWLASASDAPKEG